MKVNYTLTDFFSSAAFQEIKVGAIVSMSVGAGNHLRFIGRLSQQVDEFHFLKKPTRGQFFTKSCGLHSQSSTAVRSDCKLHC